MFSSRRIKTALVSLSTAGILGVGALAAAPAHAATVGFSIRDGYIATPSQGAGVRDNVFWTNSDGHTHHLVSYGTNWSLDVWLAPGQSVSRTFATRGVRKFRVADQSRVDAYGCHGSCGSVTVR